jgi:fibronectin-binding autotransporter adhesin
VNPLGFGLGSTNTVTIVSDRATPGAAVDRNLTTPNGLGNGQINFTNGAKVTSGTGRITYSQLSLSAGSAGTLVLNPTGPNVSIVGSVTKVANTPAQTVDLSGTTTANEISGVISNGTATISLAKSGTSTWTLTSDNTYTGTTTISGGTLAIGNGGFGGSLGTGAVTNNAILSFNRADTSLVVNNAISGSGALNQIGSGKTTLSGVSTYNGPTTISAGTLAVTGSINNSAVNVTSGTLDGTGSVGPTTVADNALAGIANGNGGNGTLTLNALSFSGDATVSVTKAINATPFIVTNALSTTASGPVVINGSGTWSTGVNNLINFGSFSGSLSHFSLGSITGLTSRQSLGSLAVNGNNIALNIIGEIVTWTGKDDNNWAVGLTGTLKNWKVPSGPTDYLDTDEVLFDDTATGSTTIDLGSFVSPNNTTFNNSTKNYTLNSTSGFGILSGPLTKTGTGSLTINIGNSHNLGTFLNGGTLNLGHADALGNGSFTVGTGSAKTLNANSGALNLNNNIAQQWNDNFTFTGSNDLNMGAGNVALGGTGTSRSVSVNGSVLTVGHITSANGSGMGLTKAGAGKLAIDGTAVSNIDGDLNVTGGTLAIGDQDFSAKGLTGSGTIENGSAVAKTLTINNVNNNTFSGILQDGTGGGTLGLTKDNTGVLTLTGANSYTGITAIHDGATVVMGHGQALGAIGPASIVRFTATSNAATLDIATNGGSDTAYKVMMGSNSTINIVSNRATPGPGIDHPLSTSGDNVLDGFGTGTINFTSGSNVTSGVGSISFNQLNLAAGGVGTTMLNPTTARVTIGTVAKNKNNANQTLELGGTSTGNHITGTISNILPSATNTAVVSLAKSGTSTWTLSGDSTYTGATTISSGTLLVNGDNSAATGAVTVSSGGTLGGIGKIGGDITMQAGSAFASTFSGGTIDPMDVGNLDLSALNNILTVIGSGTSGPWTIINYSGALTGTFENVTAGYSVNYGTGSNSSISISFAGLPGDFNSDGKVDAGDYVTWRKNNGTNNVLANDGGLGTPIGQNHFNLWRANFGKPPGAGAGLGGNAAVPEPGTIVLTILGCLWLTVSAGRRRS